MSIGLNDYMNYILIQMKSNNLVSRINNVFVFIFFKWYL